MDLKDKVRNLLDTRQKKIIFAAVAAVIVLLIIFLVILGSMGSPLDPSDNRSVSVTVEEGSGTNVIATKLTEAGIIESPFKFKLWSRIKGYDSEYKAGTYALSPSMGFSEIADILVGGKTSMITFMIPEGYTIYQVADTLSERGLVNREKFVELLEAGKFDYDFLSGAQNNTNHLEGYLFPNTYSLNEGASEEEYIEIMLNQFGKEFTDEYYQKAKEMGLSVNEVVTVASIIERECQAAEERPLVASVIYNRLKAGMPLQMCSTVQYILGENKPVLSIADTRIESPYNTYIHQGLPPGPICSPGIASIDAALNPADTDYLYFVLSEKLDGTSNFSSNYEQFQRDSAAYNDAYEAANG